MPAKAHCACIAIFLFAPASATAAGGVEPVRLIFTEHPAAVAFVPWNGAAPDVLFPAPALSVSAMMSGMSALSRSAVVRLGPHLKPGGRIVALGAKARGRVYLTGEEHAAGRTPIIAVGPAGPSATFHLTQAQALAVQKHLGNGDFVGAHGLLDAVYESAERSGGLTALEGDAAEVSQAPRIVNHGVAGDFVVVPLPPEGFLMGSPDHEPGRSGDEVPHVVRITRPYSVGKFPVTQRLWVDIMGDNPSNRKEENLPVTNVSWDDVQIFIERLNAHTGESFRLPTEAEWEYAARGGSLGARYGDIDAIAWHGDNSRARPHEVGTKGPNAFGFHDMIGNVGEWTSDRYGPYPKGPENNPQGPQTGWRRVVRGGSFIDDAKAARAASRDSHDQDYSDGFIGFRLAH